MIQAIQIKNYLIYVEKKDIAKELQNIIDEINMLAKLLNYEVVIYAEDSGENPFDSRGTVILEFKGRNKFEIYIKTIEVNDYCHKLDTINLISGVIDVKRFHQTEDEWIEAFENAKKLL